jgi:hypothetical protein
MEVIFHGGLLPWRSSSMEVVFHLIKMCKIVLSSSRVDLQCLQAGVAKFQLFGSSYMEGHLTWRSTSLFSNVSKLFWALLG